MDEYTGVLEEVTPSGKDEVGNEEEEQKQKQTSTAAGGEITTTVTLRITMNMFLLHQHRTRASQQGGRCARCGCADAPCAVRRVGGAGGVMLPAAGDACLDE